MQTAKQPEITVPAHTEIYVASEDIPEFEDLQNAIALERGVILSSIDSCSGLERVMATIGLGN